MKKSPVRIVNASLAALPGQPILAPYAQGGLAANFNDTRERAVIVPAIAGHPAGYLAIQGRKGFFWAYRLQPDGTKLITTFYTPTDAEGEAKTPFDQGQVVFLRQVGDGNPINYILDHVSPDNLMDPVDGLTYPAGATLDPSVSVSAVDLDLVTGKGTGSDVNWPKSNAVLGSGGNAQAGGGFADQATETPVPPVGSGLKVIPNYEEYKITPRRRAMPPNVSTHGSLWQATDGGDDTVHRRNGNVWLVLQGVTSGTHVLKRTVENVVKGDVLYEVEPFVATQSFSQDNPDGGINLLTFTISSGSPAGSFNLGTVSYLNPGDLAPPTDTTTVAPNLDAGQVAKASSNNLSCWGKVIGVATQDRNAGEYVLIRRSGVLPIPHSFNYGDLLFLGPNGELTITPQTTPAVPAAPVAGGNYALPGVTYPSETVMGTLVTYTPGIYYNVMGCAGKLTVWQNGSTTCEVGLSGTDVPSDTLPAGVAWPVDSQGHTLYPGVYYNVLGCNGRLTVHLDGSTTCELGVQGATSGPSGGTTGGVTYPTDSDGNTFLPGTYYNVLGCSGKLVVHLDGTTTCSIGITPTESTSVVDIGPNGGDPGTGSTGGMPLSVVHQEMGTVNEFGQLIIGLGPSILKAPPVSTPFSVAQPATNNIAGIPISGTTPTDGQTITYNSSTGQYVPTTPPATGVTAVTGTAPIASSGGTTPNISLNNSGITAGTYTLSTVTFDVHGVATAASSGTPVPDATSTVKGIIKLTNDLGGTASVPTVVRIGGVAITGIPVLGDIPTATSGSASTWQALPPFVSDVTASAPIASTGGTTPNISLNASGVTAGSYTNGNFTVNAEGLMTAAANGTAGTVTSVTGTSPINSSGGTTPAISISDATTSAKGAVQLAGDIGGTATSVTVTKLQNRAVAATAPSTNDVLEWNGTQWAPTALAAGGVTSVTGTPPIASSGGSTPAISLNNSGVTAGSYTNASVVFDARGLATSAASGTAPVTSVTGTSPISSSGGATPAISLNASGVTAGSYTNGNFTVDANGIMTSAANGTAGMTNPMTTAKDIIVGGVAGAPARLAVGANSTFFGVDGSGVQGYYTPSAIGVSLGSGLIVIVDSKATNTGGGTATSGAWRTRDLNTEKVDTGNYATVASNQITLLAGNYWVDISAPAYNCNRHQARLRDITNSTTLITGSSEQAAGTTQTRSVIRGRIVLSGTTVLEVQHQVQSSSFFGIESGSSFTVAEEIYCVCVFVRE